MYICLCGYIYSIKKIQITVRFWNMGERGTKKQQYLVYYLGKKTLCAKGFL